MSITDKIKESVIAKMLLIVIIPWIILAIVFGFTDLAITKAVMNTESAWGNFGADYGEVPGYGLIAIGIAILIGVQASKKTNEITSQKKVALVLAAIGFIVMVIGLIINDDSTIHVGGAIGVSVVLLTLFTWNKDWKNYQTFAIVVVLLAIIYPLITVQTMKVVWGRVRPRHIYALGGDKGSFTPWFVINGITGNKSFPSGHTAMGWMLLPVLLLVDDRERKDPVKILIWLIVIFWGLFVGASRVVVMAHFASDVLFSTALPSIVMILLYNKYYTE
ncbi:MAG: phosphatase PAP2 family protein [Promethearchaeia archaeon]